MPRASFTDFSTGGGFQIEGNFEVTDARFEVVQLPPNKEGKQSDPFPALVFDGYKLDEGWDRVEDADIVSASFRVGPNLENFRPGSLENPDNLDEEPEDLGREVGTRGNALYAEPGKKPFADSAFAMLIESLMKPGGFKPSEIAKACATVFVGMKLNFKQVAMKSYKNKDGKDVTPTTSVCSGAIHVYPYDKKAASAKGGAKNTAKPGATKTTAKSAPAEANSDDIAETLMGVIAAHADQIAKAFPAGTPVKVSTFRMKMQQFFMMDKLDKETQKVAVDYLKNDEQLGELGVAANFLFDPEAGTVTFQE